MIIERLRALEKAVELVAKANVPELEPFGGEVSAKDGDVVADCYYNAAHENDAEDVSRAIASAVNFIREHGSALIAELGQEVGAVAWPSERVSIADPHDPGYRIVGFKISENHPWHGKYGLSEPLNALDRAISNSPAHTSEARDSERLNWLDRTNGAMRMGWNVRQAPAGNVSIQSVIFLGRDPVGIRDAIDAAMRQEGGNG